MFLGEKTMILHIIAIIFVLFLIDRALGNVRLK